MLRLSGVVADHGHHRLGHGIGVILPSLMARNVARFREVPDPVMVVSSPSPLDCQVPGTTCRRRGET